MKEFFEKEGIELYAYVPLNRCKIIKKYLLDKTNKRAFLNYAWGVWTTAWARWHLQVAIDVVDSKSGGYCFVYCDTDSVKFIDDGTISFDSYNQNRKDASESNGGTAEDPEGNRYYLGLYEYEGTYKEFVTMGAKKYAYVDQDDKLHITVAGASKKKGAKELEKRGGIKSFKEGFVFYEAGGTESVYNDKPEISELYVDGHVQYITSNVLIRESTYTLGVTGEYRKILNNPQIWLDLFS